MTPELVPLPSPNFHTTPTEGRLSIGRFNVYRLPTRRVFSGTRLELMTLQPVALITGYRYQNSRLEGEEKERVEAHILIIS
ncbi:hypothetical protein TNCV_3332261 [Trichonephila clavipes]|nr:hypothetical protein TNCV_3332261 [Trichonephila clavipes]